ncbi:sacsin N-terminal ATP-binding-like domain-containing protein [Thioalkalivibrio sp. HK1]|uniref:sacsin N-terminal ATP-binding-like domain-containing protein n=1 Tax=Thioalkalivibrio sp. HK1 TaxID=1469245 RepID=UPI000472E2E9|nr:hypothetical protein [Thioalkalivibrio sp. HK1]
MNENASKILKDLHKIRNDWVKVTRKNNFEDGIQRLLSDLYPDQAHFIFELLQNAEDAGATTVRFDLTEDELIVRHNGNRLFSSQDVESITSIADSTKKDDVNQIGKFGIGFKAVFAYSSTPRIYSGEYNFEINDLVCPCEISDIPKNDRETVFSFPFNNPSKKRDSCFREIKSVFESLDHTILLFLNNIEAVEWNIEGGHGGSAVREHIVDTDEELIKISIANSSNDHLQEDAWFLRFQKGLESHGDLKCSIALKLGFRKESQTALDPQKRLSKQMKVIPANGQLCVFFPAEKETTGLKLSINGPYAATIDRASIKHDHEDNQEIMRVTAGLLVEAMERLKDIGLLTSDFLEVLPNRDDELSPFYSIMEEIVYDALHNKALIPCLDGGYEKADRLARGPKDLTDVIDEDALMALFRDGKLKWASGVMRNSRSDKLFTSLDVPYYGYKELVDAVENKYGYQPRRDPDRYALKWLRKQSDGWLQSFYLLLSTATRREEREDDIDLWEIIKDQNGEILTGDCVYFPVEGNSSLSNLSTVSVGIFDGLKKDRGNRLQKFLETAGVKHVGESEEIKEILDRFYAEDSKVPGKKRHLEHIKRFIDWHENGSEMTIFGNYYLFLNSTDKSLQGRHCYMDAPLEETGLGAIYSDGSGKDDSRSALWSGYAKIKKFIPFAVACGARKTLEIKRVSIFENPRSGELYSDRKYARWVYSTGINEDYSMESLEEILEENNVNIARLVWKILAEADPRVLKAKYRPNKSYCERSVPSSLVQILHRKKWIPGKDGQFYTPGEMSKKSLRDDFEYDDRNGWLTAIGFGEEEQKETEEYRIRQESAKQLGITLDDVSLINRLKKDPELYEKTKRNVDESSMPKAFPERPSTDPKRRIQQAKVRAEEASKREYESRNRSVRVSKPAGDSITYLEQSYTDSSDRLICQMCENEMPFRRRDDRYYFETVQVLDDLDAEHIAAYVALCPLCAAKFKELVKRDDDQHRRLRDDIAASEDLRIELDLGKESGSLRFVETHLLDIKAFLEAENE